MSEEEEKDKRQPRKNPDLVGHGEAERALLDAFNANRLPHAWLITGPKGVGKATLAYRFGRFLLAQGQADGLFGAASVPPDSLQLAPENPTYQRVAAGTHGDLKLVTRTLNKQERLRNEIIVDDVRSVGTFLSMTPAEGGWRVVIVDTADEMNRNAANALLKVLEEPPQRAILLLVCHNPGRLLPTIRSRCRKLVLRPLDDATVADLIRASRDDIDPTEAIRLARLAEGSVGRALDLAADGGLEFYDDLLALLGSLPVLDTEKLHKLSDRLNRKGNEAAFGTVMQLLGWWLGRLVLHGAGKDNIDDPAEKEVMDGLLAAAPLDRWLEVWEKIEYLIARATGSGNLDKKQLVLNVFLTLENQVRR